ncbi:peptide/nickel transport system permease protein [Bacillus pakistanensis]|uniref:Peptide/nickel transport system permease protein n=1 Tax=Rossellomorea pakistanensis TaxID=992288 RepID=A0ABS2NJM2_9BACI|nr:ABC transporter permease subunit [Bacillus pakistanensis]MBM7587959.1 peptide/nickel transport system permease protein [Bacillus pakistanensis]
MKQTVWKNPIFLTGFSFIILLLVLSFGYSMVWGNDVRKLYFISENAVPIESAPISPKWAYPLGTDPLGLDMLGKIIIGAKYTILTAFVIAFLRVFLALPIGFLLGTYLIKQKKYINGIIDSFHYIPLSILAYFLLHPVLWEPIQGFSTTIVERFIIEILVLSLLIVPIVSSLLGNEIALIYKQDYITSAKTIGASRFRIINKHIFPAIREKLMLLFGQQVMHTLIIFIHLGLLKLFLGGTDITYNKFPDPPKPITYEWSGLIGDTFRYLQEAPWVPLTPILFFAATMLSVALMMEGYVQATSGQSYYLKKFKQKYSPVKAKEKIHTRCKSDFGRRHNRTLF